RFRVSADLVTLTSANFLPAHQWRGVCWVAELGVFVAVADSGSTSRAVVSYDGINWQNYASASATFRGVCWSRPLSRLAAVATASTNKAMYSQNSSPWLPGLKPIRFTEIGCPAVDKGTNQPNVFLDPKSSESTLPFFSNGGRDDAIQRRYLEALIGYWSTPANNPVSALYGGPMIDMGEAAVWCWDARPHPTWPARADVWGDTANWTVGHWLNGRLGASGLGDLVLAICARSGIDSAALDVNRIAEAVPGYVIASLESPRASIEPLARYFGFDVVESQGAMRFVARGAGPVATITVDGVVAGEKAEGEDIEFVRGQETELPRVLKWRLLSADEDYEAVTVEARRVTVDSVRVRAEQFAIAHPPDQADRNARRALFEAWIGRETATFSQPPSPLALNPTDIVTIENDGRSLEFGLTQIADNDARRVEAVRRDPMVHNLGPGPSRGVSTDVPVVFGPPDVEILDLPQLSEDVPAHRPLAAVSASPWYGQAAIWRSASLDGFSLFATADLSAQFGVLAVALPSGPTSRFDRANAIALDISGGTLQSVTDEQLFAGANLLALETAAGVWELIQFATATIVSPGRWTLSRLLRGQAGTEDAILPLAPIGSRIVFLGAALVALPISESEIGMPWNWRFGPSDRAAGDAMNLPLTYTPQGRGLRPWSPFRIKGVWQGSGDIAVAWARRTRSLAGDSWTAPEVPLGEASESYDLLVLNGAGATIRTVAGLASSAWTYTAAMQTADFGGPVASLRLRIFQNGQLGRGAAADITLTP
ncbi:glycoside hydrolase/phage tail family protein, partial [Paenibacillus sp. AK121]|uniref:baseplate megatron protein TIM-barrel domain-containing protein n=1 Tax=Paenibacillus sp. AK121 TaxID=2849670 RepID=UPI001C21E9C2